MAGTSSIEWTERSWNPLTGCTKISAGCRHCYAERMAYRLEAMGQPNYRNGFELTLHEHALGIPLSWRKPAVVFVNSMSDLFHEEVPEEFIQRTFCAMREAHWHTFQVLTKRAKRLFKLSPHIDWPNNVLMGVTVESADYLHRVDCLQETGAAGKFLSLEPLLGPMPDLNLEGIDWVIVGGESGPGARRLEESWVLQIRDACLEADVPFFFKQWGGVNKKKNGRLLENREWLDMPKRLVTPALPL